MNIKIAVAYHKIGTYVKNEQLIPVQVGSTISSNKLGIQKDNDGDNISERNGIYCELTALYWIWKNTTADYKGLSHYRRCLCEGKKHFYGWNTEKCIHYILRTTIGIRKPYETSLRPYIDFEEPDKFAIAAETFTEKLSQRLTNDIAIVTSIPLYYFPYSVSQHFAWDIDIRYYHFLLNIVKEVYPDFYPWLLKTSQGHTLYSGNIAIMRNDIFDEYCTLLFDILEKHIEYVKQIGFINDPFTEKSYSRVSGYLAEMITNAIIHKIKAKQTILEYPIAFLK